MIYIYLCILYLNMIYVPYIYFRILRILMTIETELDP